MISDAEIHEILDDFEASERFEFVLSTVAFTVASKMVQHGDVAVLARLPEKLREAVLNMAHAYERDGELVSLSSAGMAFHNELGARLLALVKTSGGYRSS